MTGVELVEALRKTGTGAKKLAVAQRAVDRDRDCDGAAVLRELEREQQFRKDGGNPGWAEGTLVKVRELLRGVPLAEFLGKPPPHGIESKIERIGNGLVERVGEAMDKVLVQSQKLKLPVARPTAPTT